MKRPFSMNHFCQIEYVSSDSDVGTLREPAVAKCRVNQSIRN
jgi:hypothetical protein